MGGVRKVGPTTGGVPRGPKKGNPGSGSPKGLKQIGPSVNNSGSIRRGDKIQGGAKKGSYPGIFGGGKRMGGNPKRPK